MEYECMLTTFDNPYDPFEEFTLWFLFDIEKGYNSCSYLARIATLLGISDELSDVETNKIIEESIDNIIKYDFLDVYKKVKRTSNESSDETQETQQQEQPLTK